MSIRGTVSILWLAVCLVLIGCSRDPIAERIAKLNDPNVELRRTAAREFAERPASDERAIAALAKSAADADIDVRYASIDALGKLGPEAKSGLPVLKIALADSEKAVRIRAAWSMSNIDPQDRSFVPVLVAAMREGDGRVLLEVGATGPPAAWAVPTLTGLLSHESPKVRTLAAKALGGIGPAAKVARPGLEVARGDSNAAVKTAAKEALNRIRSGQTARGPAQ
jgi:HEAT repeat protein